MKEISCNHREVRCKSDAIWKVGDLSKINTGCQDKSAKEQNRTVVYKFSLLHFAFPLPTKFGKLVYVILNPDFFFFFPFKSLLISFGEFTVRKVLVRSTLAFASLGSCCTDSQLKSSA